MIASRSKHGVTGGARVQPIDWGDLRRLSPISTEWGFDRGGPIDRYYIEQFLVASRADIRGRVLEVKDSQYTERFGAGVTTADSIDINSANTHATIIADLTNGDGIPSDAFDCFLLTQTLHQIFDIRSALSQTYRLLRPGGVLLCTLPSVSRVDSHYEGGGFEESDYWRFTGAAVRRLFLEFFPADLLEITGFGNVLTCVGFLYGLAPGELTREELDFVDPWFPLLFCVRAVKPATAEKRGDI